MPTADSRNSSTPRYKAPRLPRSGTSNHSTTSTRMKVASTSPINIPGMDFPIRISIGRSGVTSN